MATLQVVCNSITPTKNGSIFMANTAKGGFIVRKAQLDKRGIDASTGYKFPETTVVIVKTHKKGDYLFPDTAGIAPQDSSRLDATTGAPVYVKGDKPVWDNEGASVQSFVGFNEFKAQLELESLMKAVATS